jgi:ribose transport system substrate-binding protein
MRMIITLPISKIVFTTINDQTMAGAIASLQGAGRWNPDDTINITLGLDELGRSLIRDGLADADIAFFPERYGEFIVPAICVMMEGEAIPPWIYTELEVLSMGNIDKWYPQK